MFDDFNKVYATFWPTTAPLPVRGAFEVANLAGGGDALVEIQCEGYISMMGN
jgi:hypothetical protein